MSPPDYRAGQDRMPKHTEATPDGRWGIRQVRDGEPTGGGTVGCGWATREEAEAANPYRGGLELEAYDRFGGGA